MANRIQMKITSLLFCCIVLSFLSCRSQHEKLVEEYNGIVYETVVSFKHSKDKIEFRAKAWGIAGNHEEIRMSEKSADKSDSSEDYIFYTSEVYYSTLDSGVITVYAPEALIKEPDINFSSVEVILVGLKNADEISDYELNHLAYGLKQISVHRE